MSQGLPEGLPQGGSIYTPNTLHHLKELGLDSQRAHKTALTLHAQSVHYVRT